MDTPLTTSLPRLPEPKRPPRTLVGLLLLRRRAVVMGVLTLILVDLLQYGIPLLIKRVVDTLEAGTATPARLLRDGLLVVALGLGVLVLRILWRRLLLVASRRTERWLRDQVYLHLLRLDFYFYHRYSLGDLMARLTNDMEAIRMALAFGVIAFVDFLLYTLFSVIAMDYLSWKLMLIAMLPLPFLTGVVTVLGRKIHREFRRVQDTFGDLSERTRVLLANTKLLKAYRQEEGAVTYYEELNRTFIHRNLKLARIQGFFEPSIQFLASLGVLLVLVFGGRQVAYGTLSLGSYVAFFSYLGMMVWPMMALGWTINLYQRASASLDRVHQLLEARPRIQSPRDGVRKPLEGHVVLRNLSFAYPDGTPALQDLQLDLEAGTFVGITGPTGSGKSTLLRLLFRFLDPPPGSILLDGFPVERWDLPVLRAQVGYVPQEPLLFSATLRENLLLGGQNVPEEALWEALWIAGMDEEVRKMPRGLDTPVGERGVTLSGGQKQRLSIARVLLKHPRLLLLDDPLSHVDPGKEREILDRLIPALRGRTVLWVTHRVTQVLKADRVLFMDQGKVVEDGEPDHLLQQKGHFWGLYALQSRIPAPENHP